MSPRLDGGENPTMMPRDSHQAHCGKCNRYRPLRWDGEGYRCSDCRNSNPGVFRR